MIGRPPQLRCWIASSALEAFFICGAIPGSLKKPDSGRRSTACLPPWERLASTPPALRMGSCVVMKYELGAIANWLSCPDDSERVHYASGEMVCLACRRRFPVHGDNL